MSTLRSKLTAITDLEGQLLRIMFVENKQLLLFTEEEMRGKKKDCAKRQVFIKI